NETRDVVIEQTLPHAPEIVWKTLASSELMARWISMKPAGYEPVVGTHFTLQTTPAGKWNGVIQCQVLEAIPSQRLSYSWKSGHEDNPGYGSRLDTVVTFTLSRVENGTRLRLVHSGFVTPRNESTLKTLGEGWKVVVPRIGAISGEHS